MQVGIILFAARLTTAQDVSNRALNQDVGTTIISSSQTTAEQILRVLSFLKGPEFLPKLSGKTHVMSLNSKYSSYDTDRGVCLLHICQRARLPYMLVEARCFLLSSCCCFPLVVDILAEAPQNRKEQPLKPIGKDLGLQASTKQPQVPLLCKNFLQQCSKCKYAQ